MVNLLFIGRYKSFFFETKIKIVILKDCEIDFDTNLGLTIKINLLIYWFWSVHCILRPHKSIDKLIDFNKQNLYPFLIGLYHCSNNDYRRGQLFVTPYALTVKEIKC